MLSVFLSDSEVFDGPDGDDERCQERLHRVSDGWRGAVVMVAVVGLMSICVAAGWR